jgi:hypothetical protein
MQLGCACSPKMEARKRALVGFDNPAVPLALTREMAVRDGQPQLYL